MVTSASPSPHPSESVIAYLRDPAPRPLHGFQFEVADATGEEDDAFDPPLPQPHETRFALLLQQFDGHRPLPVVIPKITTEDFSAADTQRLQPSQAVAQAA